MCSCTHCVCVCVCVYLVFSIVSISLVCVALTYRIRSVSEFTDTFWIYPLVILATFYFHINVRIHISVNKVHRCTSGALV